MQTKIKILLFFLLVIMPWVGIAQYLYKSTQIETDFFSSAPIENIHAVSKKGKSVLNAETGEVLFEVRIRTFQFRKAKMQEHFNENFMESVKYPTATFKGKIREKINVSENGEYPVTLRGILDIHGVKENREIPAKLNIQNGNMKLQSKFDVACKDHDIEIPKILWKNIAEVVRVKVNANYVKM
ncbi:YceI family protein [Salegentibacter sp. JZCK2]|uniref:YceI family protein n=1 Tax=Salegentibacter tibetensis TaxID=2873600 RepID=UPI001CCE66C8|nr:YceI family protein [Salegentibacter tibetensis]MBZ9731363.1 YceI family protein [Salegentibacter tibetensis]